MEEEVEEGELGTDKEEEMVMEKEEEKEEGDVAVHEGGRDNRGVKALLPTPRALHPLTSPAILPLALQTATFIAITTGGTPPMVGPLRVPTTATHVTT